MPYPADITRVDVDINYGPTSTVLVNPLIEAFILRNADMVKDAYVITYSTDRYLIRMNNYTDVDYVILHHTVALPVAPVVMVPVDVMWTDDTSSDLCLTQLENSETMIIPNPLKYDAVLGLGGIELFCLEPLGIEVHVIVVGNQVVPVV